MLNINPLTLLVLLTAAKNGLSYPAALIEERAAAITLGAAETFGIISGTTITNGGLSVITGICGVFPGVADSGFPPGVCTGGINLNNAPASAAQGGCLSAFNAASTLVTTEILPSPILGGAAGQTLGPGVYSFPASGVTASGVLTLNGPATGQWIFKVTTTFTTAAGTKVVLVNGALAKNVFFIVGSSATLGAGTLIAGNVLAHTAITLGGAANINGTLCAITAAVNLSANKIIAQ